jgi:dTMP kinase
MLAECLRDAGHAVLATREPGGTPGAERVRALLLGSEVSFVPLAEAMLHAAARAEHVARVIRPALEVGTIVLCDRFSDSTMAYQAFGQGADAASIAALARLIGLIPNLTLVLDVSEAVARARLASRGGKADRYEAEAEAFHRRVRDGFRAIAAAEPARCAVIAADGKPDAVLAAVKQAVVSRLGLAV